MRPNKKDTRLFPRGLHVSELHLFFLPPILYLIVMVIFPTVFTFGMSFTNWSPRAENKFVGLQNYINFLNPMTTTGRVFYHDLEISCIYVAVSVTLEFVLGIGLALLISQKIRLSGLLRTLFILPLMLAPVASAMSWRFMFDPDYGIINYLMTTVGLKPLGWLADPNLALAGIVVVEVWQWTPFMFLVLLAGIQSLPTSLYEAANIDGASSWQIFKSITIPLLKSIIAIAILLRAIDAFKSFDYFYMMTRGGPGRATESLTILTWLFSFVYFEIGRASALSVIFAIILMSLATVLLRQLYAEVE